MLFLKLQRSFSEPIDPLTISVIRLLRREYKANENIELNNTIKETDAFLGSMNKFATIDATPGSIENDKK